MKTTTRILQIAALAPLIGLASLQAQTTLNGDYIFDSNVTVEGAGGVTIDYDLQVNGSFFELGTWSTTTALMIEADTSATPAKITFSGSDTDTLFSWETDGTATTPTELMRLNEDGVLTLFDAASSNTMVFDPAVPSLTVDGIDYLAGYGTATRLVDSLGNTVALVDGSGNLVFDAGSTVTFDGAVVTNGTLTSNSLQVGASEAVDGDRFGDMIEISKLLSIPDTTAEDWIANLYGSSVITIAGVGVDANSYRYIAGTFQGTMTVGDTTLTSAGLEDIFIAKYNLNGVVQWAKSYGGSDADVVTAISVSSNGKLAICGHFSSSDLVFDVSALAKTGADEDIFVARIIGSTGDSHWAQSFGGNDTEYPQAVSVSDTGEVTIAGDFFSNSLQIGTDTLSNTNISTEDIFVARMAASDGAPIWAKSFASTVYDRLGGLAVNSTGDVFITGIYRGASIDIDSITLTAVSHVDFFVARLDGSNGNAVWAESFSGGNGYEYSYALTLDNNEDVLIGGRFGGADLVIGSTTLLRSGSFDAFVALLSSSTGTPIWAKSFTGNGDDRVNALSVTSSGEVIVGGYYSYSTNVPLEIVSGEILPSAGSNDIFVAGLDGTDGSANWARSYGSSGDDRLTSLIAAPDGKISMTVTLSSAAAFGSRVGLAASLYSVNPVWLQAYSATVPSQTSLSFYGGAAIGESAIALGAGSIAEGDGSFVWGANNVALGTGSTALGSNTSAGAYLSAAMGQYNVGGFDGANNGDTQWVDLDTLFEIGNGTGEANRSNALTLLKNGQLTVENKYWDDQDPTAIPADPDGGTSADESTEGQALVVKGHAELEGNLTVAGSVTIAHIPVQSDIEMGPYDGAP